MKKIKEHGEDDEQEQEELTNFIEAKACAAARETCHLARQPLGEGHGCFRSANILIWPEVCRSRLNSQLGYNSFLFNCRLQRRPCLWTCACQALKPLQNIIFYPNHELT